MRTWLKLVFVAAIVQTLGACAFHTEEVDIKYGAPQSAAQVPGANGVAVSVTTLDERVANRDRISTKRNGYYMPLAPILSSRDVAEIVRESVESEFRAQGYRIETGGRTIEVKLMTFYTEMGFGAHASVNALVSVKAPDGTVLASMPMMGDDSSALIIANLAVFAREHLERALRKFALAVAEDSTIRTALIGQPAATVPSPALEPGRPDS